MSRPTRSNRVRAAARRLALPALLVPAAAEACAVCGATAERNRIAFLIMTIVMSVLPLAMFAAGGLWLRRNIRRAHAREAPTVGHSNVGSIAAERPAPTAMTRSLARGADASR